MRKQQMTQILTFILFMTLSSFAFSTQNFENEVRNAQKVCPHLRCENAPVKLVAVDIHNSHEFPRALLLKLQSTSTEVANNIWPDTIFEGGVVSAEDEITLESVYLVFNSEGHIGYRITYTAVAYNLDVCEKDDDVKSCQKGKIYESAFVSNDFSVTFADYADLAHFIRD